MPSLISPESMSPTFTPSAEESALVAKLFARGEPHKLGVLTGEVALDLFSQTNLSVPVLSDIWSIADKDGRGWLSPTQTAVAVRLIGWAQVGVKATPDLLEKPGPLAKIPDAPSAGPSRIASSVIPSITPVDKAKFHRLFLSSGPVDGLIDGDKARGIFSKSKLSDEQLSQIWELSDTEHRNALDSKGFTIALHLIQGLMNNRFSVVPAFLSDELYEQAAAAVTEPLSPLSPIPTSPSSASANGQDRFVRADLNKRSSLSGSPASSRHSDDTWRISGWSIPSDVKSLADRQFDALDPLKNGFIHDNISLPFLLESKLPPDELARIWALADLNGDMKLTRDGFAVALFLIDERRRGNPLPAYRPSSLKAPDRSYLNGQEPQSPHTPEKAAYAQLSPNANLQRQPSHVRYPALPSQSTNVRFSSIWTNNQPNSPGPLASPTTPDPAVAQLTRQVREMQKLITQLRQSHIDKATAITNLTQENVSLRVVVDELQTQVASCDPESEKVISQVLAKENEGLRAAVQELKETVHQLQSTSSDVEMQRIQYEDLVRENERLADCVKEMRESTTQLPWSGGDSELQTLINEDLARENARLRTEAREMQENVAQLQEATSGYEEQRRLNAELSRDNERMQATIRTMQTRLDAQRTEVGQLSREVDRLKTQIRVNAGPSRTHTLDLPPPAYNELDQTLT
ncbi:hypothetical protein B0H19DRAFT_1176771 [Mycena capillaripes]|nr:hypothetical protein B0H19DRAFT_1176771 [Mycena capillaripes]